MLGWLRRKLQRELHHSLAQDRETLLRFIVLMLLLPGSITAIYFGVDWLTSGARQSLYYVLWSLTAHPAMGLCYLLARRKQLDLACVVPPVWMWLSGTLMLWWLGPDLLLVFQLVGGIVFAGLLLSPPWALVSATASVFSYAIMGSIASTRLNPGGGMPNEFMIQLLILGLCGVMLVLFFMLKERGRTQRLEQTRLALEQRVTEQSEDMEANERRLHAQFKGMPVPTFAWRWIDDDYVLVDYNDAAMQQTRDGVQQFVNARASDLYANRTDIINDLERCYHEQSQFQREMRYAFELTDDERELRVTYAFIAPDTILVHTEDITEQRRAQVALREGDRRMATLLSNLPGMAYRCVDDEHWTIEYVSQGCLALTGHAPEDLVCNRLLSYADLVHHQDLPHVQAAVNAGHANDGSFEMTYRIVTADGQIKWVWEQGCHVPGTETTSGAIEGIIMDVTESHQAQVALRASEARNRSLVEAFPDAIVVTDRALNILMVNHAAQRIYGVSASDALNGTIFYDLIAPHDRERARDHVGRGVGTGPKHHLEYEMAREDGSSFPAELNATLANDFEGRQEVLILFVRDITERRHLQQQLQAALKLEAVGRLAGGIAHDFNNLLTVINGYAGFLAEGLASDSSLHADAVEVQRAGERAAHLTRQLLAFSRRQVIQTEVMSLNDVVLDIEPMLRSLLGETIRLECDLAPDLALARLDRAQIERAITNLVTNARDAMPTGGRLRLSTGNLTLEQRLLAVPDDIDSGHYVVLSVSDDGVGMSEEVRERALEPFFTTKDVGQGTGLGLSMVYGTIKQLSGAMHIESQPGAGATIHLYLPVSHQQGQAHATPEAPSALLAGTETILLVEDEALVREYVARALRQLGYRIIESPDGEDALNRCHESQGAIDLLLSDVVMPGLSGPELAQELEKMCHIPHVLYMSGHSEDVMSHLGTLQDGVELIRKPFAPDELARRIRRLLDS